MSKVRLIDANALHKRIEMNLRASNSFTIEECCYKDALNSVDKAPTIDPESLRTMAKWIKVEDELPECSSTVIAWVIEKGYEVENGHPELCDYDSSGVWFDYDGEAVRYEPDSGFINAEETMRDVTHWMLLPENPKEN